MNARALNVLLPMFLLVLPLAAQEGGFLGISISEGRSGLPRIVEVLPGSPAAKGGLKIGDLIIAADGKKLRNSEQLFDWIAAKKAGAKVRLGIERSGKRFDLALVLSARPERKNASGNGRVSGKKGRKTAKAVGNRPQARVPGVLGVELAQEEGGRIWIDRVEPGGAAAKAGLKKGDVVLSAGGIPARDLDDLVSLIRRTGAGRPLALEVRRGGKTLEIQAFLGGRAPKPGGIVPPAATASDRVRWLTDYRKAEDLSARSGRPLLLDFRADWCAPCKRLERSFEAPEVRRLLQKVVPVRIDVDKQERLADEFGVSGIPHVVLQAPGGRVLGRFTGYLPPPLLANRISRWLGIPSKKPVGGRAPIRAPGKGRKASPAKSPRRLPNRKRPPRPSAKAKAARSARKNEGPKGREGGRIGGEQPEILEKLRELEQKQEALRKELERLKGLLKRKGS